MEKLPENEEFKALITEEELHGVFAELQNWGDCVGLYMHGSTIFLNHAPNDLDLIAIVDGAKKSIDPNTKESQFILGRLEVSVYPRDFFLQRLEAMDMTMLTCLSTPARFVIKRLEDDLLRDFKLKLDVLEEQTSSYADYTWIKSHRLLDKTKDVYKARKNVYFAFRLLDFGCQLAEHGNIPDLTAANNAFNCVKQIWKHLQIQPGDWDVVEAIFGRHFEMMRKRFQLCMEAARSGSKAEPLQEQIENCCGLCHCEIVDIKEFQVNQLDDSECWVRLANCPHRFHLPCIANFIRTSHRTRRGGGWCPTCKAKVRVKVVTWRAYAFWGPKAGMSATVDDGPKAVECHPDKRESQSEDE